MANTSILAAFERMWQHITSALSNKSDTDHTHSNATQAASGFLSAEDKTQLDNGGIPIVTASSSDGVTYTATVDGMSALTIGMKFTIIPSVNSASTTPTLNVNGLGAKYIRMPITYNTSAVSAGAVDTWLVKNKPVTLEYDGTYFRTISMPRPSAQYLYGVVPVANGGVPSSTTDDDGKVLCVVDGTASWQIHSWNELNDKPFYIETVSLYDGTLTDFMDVGDGYYYASPNIIPLDIEIGKTYTVLFDGTEYSCTAYLSLSDYTQVIGNWGVYNTGDENDNYHFYGGTDTGEPFIIHAADGEAIVYTNVEGDSHTLYIAEVNEVINTESLPETKVLPDVTTDNNGAFLRVVDGAWAVATVPAAEEASF